MKKITSKRQLQRDRKNLKSVINAMNQGDYYRALQSCYLTSNVFVLDVAIVKKELLNNIFYDIANETKTSVAYAIEALKVIEEELEKKE